MVEEVVAIDAALRDEMWKGISRADRRQVSEILGRLEGNLAAVLTD